MGFFDELSEKITSTGKAAAAKAKDVADMAKIKADIAAEESKLRAAYVEIGKLFCDKAEGEVDPEYVPLMQKVTDATATIANYKAVLNKIKGTILCQECGAEMEAGAQFCSVCGAQIKPNADVEGEPKTEEDQSEEAPKTEEPEPEEPADASKEE